MISVNELCKPSDFIDIDTKNNLMILCYKLNCIRFAYGQPLKINSGFRSPTEQIALYKAKGLPPKMGSFHCLGAAADISDSNGELKKWILDHLQMMEELHLYFESFDATSSWVHCQLFSPQSGSRFFKP